MERRLWFRAKDYGWGWTPSSWQGWLVLAIFFFLFIGNFFRLGLHLETGDNKVITFVIESFIMSLTLVLICYIKGEKPEWRWGKRKDFKQ